MAEWRNLTLEVADGVAVITIRRPKVLNALSWQTVAELKAAAECAIGDATVQGIVLTSEGGAIAGADIKELATVTSADAAAAMCRTGQAMVATFEHSPKPVVAAIDGPVLGGGCELSMGCHARVVGPKLLWGQPEVNLGVIPGYGGSQRLPRLIGIDRAAELLRTGRAVKAADACAWGWARGQPVADVLAEAQALVRKATAGEVTLRPVDPAPLAVPAQFDAIDIGHHSRAIDAILVDVMRRGWAQPLAAGLELEAVGFGRCADTEDMKIGLKNFIENGPRAQATFVNR